MYDRVLVPTDGSDGSLVAVEHAAELAQECNAELHTLHVVQAEGVSDALDESEYADVLERLERAGGEAIEAAREQAAAAGVDEVATAVVRGIPAEAIHDYVADNDVDVVVMATEGRTGSARELIGSVTESVVRTSSVPVLTVNVGDA
jgi:nucleotide-binding universal stress UspA family protein